MFILYLQLLIIATIIFFTIDIIWLVFIANKFYKKNIGFLLKEKPNWVAATVFYVLFVMILVYFVIIESVLNQTVITAFYRGILFGFITYATYDLTNLATIKNWPLKVSIIDIFWGSTLTSIVSVSTYYFYFLIF